MTTEHTEETTGFARFKRKISDGNYGDVEASISLPFLVEDGVDGPKTELNAKVAFIVAKTAVCRELGIETKVLDDGTVMELLDPNATVVNKAERPAETGTVGGGSSQPARPPAQRQQSPSQGGMKVKVFKRLDDPRGGVDERGKPNKIGNPDWLVSQLEAAVADGKSFATVNGYIELWDNRERLPQFGGSGNAKAPWFKGKGGDEEAIWPPKGAPENNASWRHEAFQGGGAPHDEEPF